MKGSYYLSGDQRAQGVHRLFARIASHYDLVNDIQSLGMHRLWKRRLVGMAVKKFPQRVEESCRALDLCCGTGDVSLALAREGFTVHGVDFSEEMLSIAKRRAVEKNLSICWTQTDVLKLEAESGSYDLISCVYGLRNLADIPGAIKRMYHWLKPGGQLLILDFGKPKNFFLKPLFRLYLKVVVPIFGLILCHDRKAYSYILDSLDHYPAQKGVDELLKQSGFEKCAWYSLIGGTMSISFAEKPLKEAGASFKE